MWDKADQVIALIQEHLARRPGMAPRDVYKLLYQGVRGPEHIIASPEAFTERLQAEWDSLDPADSDPHPADGDSHPADGEPHPAEDDPLWESVRPDGELLRLNLRPFKAVGGDLEVLAAACLETGQRAWGTQAELRMAWEHVIAGCQRLAWPGLAVDEITAFTSWLQANEFPPAHHSQGYRNLYRPAYRLVAADIGWQEHAT
jgi:hypothetical protein